MFNTIIAAKLNKISEIASFCGHYFGKGTYKNVLFIPFFRNQLESRPISSSPIL